MKLIKLEMVEDGEFVWAGLITSANLTQLLELADKLSDLSVLTAPSKAIGEV